jgi:AraC-like DNA-binding protein
MLQSDGVRGTPMDFEAWRALLRSTCVGEVKLNAPFKGWMRLLSPWGGLSRHGKSNRAAHLLRRRAQMDTSQPLSEVAYACGFRDHAHSARRFRNRFDYPPGTYAGQGQGAGDGVVRAGTGESVLSARDVRFPAIQIRSARR